jgi:hypothetical protein
MTSPLRKALDTIANMFTPDDLARSLADKESTVTKLEKASAEANANYFKVKIVDRAKAEVFKQEKLRLDTELGSVRDDIVSLTGMIDDATRDQRLAARARERAAIEKRVEIDKTFMTGLYLQLAKQLAPALHHLEETEALVFKFNLECEDGEERVTSAETALRRQPSQKTWLDPLYQSVSLPPVNPADEPFRKALTKDELESEAIGREAAQRIAARKRVTAVNPPGQRRTA